jgi:hypothetical protein
MRGFSETIVLVPNLDLTTTKDEEDEGKNG